MDDNKYLILRELSENLQKDPDLAYVDRVMQTLFIVTGCDYIPFIQSVGKNTILELFLQHSTFIYMYNPMFKGSCLSKTYLGNNTEGFLCFI